eukprot:1161299-Pelagomonas_calceolata.AAC.14
MACCSVLQWRQAIWLGVQWRQVQWPGALQCVAVIALAAVVAGAVARCGVRGCTGYHVLVGHQLEFFKGGQGCCQAEAAERVYKHQTTVEGGEQRGAQEDAHGGNELC